MIPQPGEYDKKWIVDIEDPTKRVSVGSLVRYVTSPGTIGIVVSNSHEKSTVTVIWASGPSHIRIKHSEIW